MTEPTVPERAAPERARLAILISGRGSNMLAIARACTDGRLDARVVGVVGDRDDAAGLGAAAALGLPTRVVERRAFADRVAFERALGAQLDALRPDRVLLAGFMQVLGAELVEAWHGRMLNIHPSLLPRHPGLDTHARALAAGDAEHGASVHLVTAELDAGPVIAQARVPVLPHDTPETLAARVLAEEHTLYVTALARSLASGFPDDRSVETDTVSRSSRALPSDVNRPRAPRPLRCP